MLISILTPSFNQAIWLKDNIYSVHKQTYPWVEHIVMDGGSTDGSIGILESSRRVIWRSEPDRGQSHALNKAFAVSSGEIIGGRTVMMHISIRTFSKLLLDTSTSTRKSMLHMVTLLARILQGRLSILCGHRLSVIAACTGRATCSNQRYSSGVPH